jgi:PIN domain nuclease of toxin-antitoxin system
MLNLDTHILLHALTGDLKARERTILSNDSWSISAIVLWEIAFLARRGRIDFEMDDPTLTALLRQVHVWPLDLEVCRKLSELDFSSDPADEIIAATSLVHRIPLVTRDRNIRSSRLLRFAN